MYLITINFQIGTIHQNQSKKSCYLPVLTSNFHSSNFTAEVNSTELARLSRLNRKRKLDLRRSGSTLNNSSTCSNPANHIER
ncbi:Os11g0596000 [Oryza sativa Japonica Group]|uniref:Os11g0596000 protein n=1 Tax=Oryza sativa subsp. japonica TaxID=39947 RepID=A0A0P0Y474_ORYSJ|nr:Os11g0596000 [Oryza sativa Japonica Group]